MSPRTWQLPIPGLPGSLRHPAACKHGNLPATISLKVPCPQQRKSPVPENRWTYPHPEYVSCPDVPEDRSPVCRSVSKSSYRENILSPPAPSKVPGPYALWISTKRSLSAFFGSFGSIFISSKYRYVKISAADKEPPGCPDLAAVNRCHNTFTDLHLRFSQVLMCSCQFSFS